MAESIIKQSFTNTVVNSIVQVTAGGLRIDFVSNGEQYHLTFNTSGNFKVVLFNASWGVVWSIPW